MHFHCFYHNCNYFLRILTHCGSWVASAPMWSRQTCHSQARLLCKTDYGWSPCVLFSSSSRVCGPEDAYNGESLIAGRCHRCSLQGGRAVWDTWCSLQTDALLSGVPSLSLRTGCRTHEKCMKTAPRCRQVTL